MWKRFLSYFVLFLVVLSCLFFSTEQVVRGQTISSEKTDVETILQAFCRQKHRLGVMECVNNFTQGQALEPWNQCLNPEKELGKKETANLACKLLRPEFKAALGVLSECVEEFVSYYEAEAWMSVLKLCAYKTDTTSDIETLLSRNNVRES